MREIKTKLTSAIQMDAINVATIAGAKRGPRETLSKVNDPMNAQRSNAPANVPGSVIIQRQMNRVMFLSMMPPFGIRVA